MNTRAWALFLAVPLLWGIPYLLITVAVDEVSPAVVVFARTALAAAVLLPVAWRLGALRGLGRRRRDLVVLSLASAAVPFLLITTGELWVSSSPTAMLIAAEPMAVALLAVRLDASQLADGGQMPGLAIGSAGLVALLGIDLAGGGLAPLGAVMILGATVCYAYGAMQVRLRFADARPLGLAAATLGFSSAVLAIPAGLTAPAAVPSSQTLWALLLFGLVCTAAALGLLLIVGRSFLATRRGRRPRRPGGVKDPRGSRRTDRECGPPETARSCGFSLSVSCATVPYRARIAACPPRPRVAAR